MGDKLTFEVCIGDIAAYNNGFLVYEWVDLIKLSWDEVVAKRNAVLEKGYDLIINKVWNGDYDAVPKHEEWHIQDYSNNIGIQVSEYSNLKTLYEYAEVIEGYDLELIKRVNELEEVSVKEVVDGDFDYDDYRFIEAKDVREFGEIIFNEYYGDPRDIVANIRMHDENSIGVLDLIARNFDYKNYGRQLVNSSGVYTKVKYGFLVHHGA